MDLKFVFCFSYLQGAIVLSWVRNEEGRECITFWDPVSEWQLSLKVPQPYRRQAVSSNSDNCLQHFLQNRILYRCSGVPWCQSSTCVTSSHLGHDPEQVTGSGKTWGIYCKGTNGDFFSLCFAFLVTQCEWEALCFLPEWDVSLPQSKQLGFFNLYHIRISMIYLVSDTWLHHSGITIMYPYIVWCCLM